MAFNARKFFSFLNRVVREISRAQPASGQRGPTPPKPASAPAGRRATGSGATGSYPGDYSGPVTFEYSPDSNGQPDPGEVVWGWVPYEEDHSQGKDRPVLLVGRDGQWLLGLMLTSKDNTNGQHQDRDYLDIGTGAWDRQGRPSEVKLDRVIRLAANDVRREGAVLDRERFKRVAQKFAANR
ncbi:type II toxin-antitoxin system PemK/MazF family toxin [Glutamicibacter sp. MNS18]|uniref:type II toxin-antitoxin system PemK/MazF family toxin n=1 Tax=Glutamicibacter sp. MNS18 TaxID=2989817 RepID=UPI0022355A84|nr:type II toxin-antitoxin system PemK/MazF family toxin [Glutamicibacter sp. MNS18]MCW4464835.1 type II toxin-antitoxin system PemK/MazF family toxin [Glutamicibacter sp. MNS18]